ncbi:adenylyltransferase/sulfurtransferase MoeZ [Planctomonas sp. JC2975]|uniref:ThiF family adenylyltransferase n=1 Tax=Planctomonas sp. JC2975 TaxID=2729626 RepID=UPI001473C357|nr:ThiF family adenylyltransferase [Planctomonas sp. JC2975]NNC12256.1 adenylyltransferase/sulfurtransferase MoeZ [Planctomonas sp. JC2975]
MLPLVTPARALTPAESERTARQLTLQAIGDEGQRRLANARVLVLGAGGLGGPALLALAAAGVGTLGIVDDDVVEASNLQRQLAHGVPDVGRSKVDSAADAIARIAPECRVYRHREHFDEFTAPHLLADYDIVLDGTDDFPTRYAADAVAATAGIPLVWAVVLGFDAQVTVFWANPNDGSPGVRLTDLFPVPPADDGATCSVAGVLGPLTAQVGSLMAAEAVKLITGAGTPLLGRILVVDALRATYREVPLRSARRVQEPISGVTPPPRRVAEGSGRQPTLDGYPQPTPARSPQPTPAGPPQPSRAEPPTRSVPAEPVSASIWHSAAVDASSRARVTQSFPTSLDAPSRESEDARQAAANVAPADRTVEVAELAERLASRAAGGPDLVLLDVREPAERAARSIPGSIGIPVGLLDRASVADLDRRLPVVVHCQSEARARRAASTLAELGFADVSVLAGGMKRWNEAQ